MSDTDTLSAPEGRPGVVKPAVSERARGIGFALLSAAGFSTLGPLGKLIFREGFSVPQALAWRFTIAAAALWVIVLITKRPPLGRKRFAVALLGVFGFSSQAGLFFVTLSMLDPGIAGLLLYLYPSFVILFSFLFLKRRPHAMQLVALCLSFIGCAITFFKPGVYPIGGLAIGAFTAMVYGAYLVVGEKVLAGCDSSRATALILSEAAMVYWVITLAQGSFKPPSNIATAGGLVAIALLATVLPIVTLFASMRRIGAAECSLLSTVEPLITIALSSIILGERLAPAQALGGMLILSAVVMIQLAPRISARIPKRIAVGKL